MENKKEQVCQVCGQTISNASHLCGNCGWVQQIDLDRPDEIDWSYNFISYNKAKVLYGQGKPLKPNFDEFLECMYVYGELEFYLDGIHYGVLTNSKNKVTFYEWNEMEKGYQEYGTITEFAEKANINGVLLKTIWDKATGINVAS